MTKSIIKCKYLYLLLLPGVIWLILFKYVPMYGLVIAFKDYNIFQGIAASPWVGWANFLDFFSYDKFWVLLKNTLLISGYKILFGFPFPILVALMLNEVRSNLFKRSIQTVVYFPHFLSWVIVGGLVITLLSPDGLVNSIITLLGGESRMWIAKSDYFRGILVASDIWKEAGWGTVVYMAALAGISVEMYEAALIDGASRLQKIWYITIPSILPTIVILLILRMGSVMEAGFEQVLILQNTNVLDVGDIIDTYVYRVGLVQRKYSYSAAVGFFKSLINLVLILGTNYTAKKMGQESLF